MKLKIVILGSTIIIFGLTAGITIAFSRPGKPAGNPQAAINIVSSRLVNSEEVSTVNVGYVAEARKIVFEPPILTGRILEVKGTIGDSHWMNDLWVSVWNVSTNNGDQGGSAMPINPDGSFDIFVPLSSGAGLYEVSIQAPYLKLQDFDDISYGPAGTWSVRVQ